MDEQTAYRWRFSRRAAQTALLNAFLKTASSPWQTQQLKARLAALDSEAGTAP